MTIDFQPLPPEHELSVAGAALVALEGQDGRLVAHAHRFALGGDASDDALADAYVTFLGYYELGMSWPPVPVARLLHELSVLVWKEQTEHGEVVEEVVAREAVARWLACFPRPFRAYTNGDVLSDHAMPHPTGGGYNPVIGATFDTGAIVIAADIIGMVWAADELKFETNYQSREGQIRATTDVLNSPLGQAKLGELDANPTLMRVRIIRAPISGERIMLARQGRDGMVSATATQATIVVVRRTDVPGDDIHIPASYGNL